jgi:predicted dehydrogenase
VSESNNRSTSRRGFLKNASAGVAALSASSYARVAGANDRIAIGIIGCGGRGMGAHLPGVHAHAEAQNIEVTAVCDPWKQRREEAVDKVKDRFGRKPKKFVSYRDVLEFKDVDAVMIASCDHQHTTHLETAAKAKKDVYCEKPLAKDLKGLRNAYDAVKENGVVVQIGTQLRSYATFTGCRELYRTGILGKVGRIEQCRNGTEPYWYSRVKPADKKDVDWDEFLMDAPKQPFNSVRFTGWYGFRDFSDGPVPGLASHFIDLVHYITGAKFPTSVVCHGGTFTWKDDYGFTAPDHVQAQWIYPEGFMVSYSTNFGNGSGNTFKFFGDVGVLDAVNWSAPVMTAEGGRRNKGAIRGKNPVEEVPTTDHYLNWLECIRSREKPNACIDAGYQHAVACLMAVQAYDTGRRQVYDHKKRRIREG